ncbi:TIGR01906 family membrane protein [Candidatus Woesearchaeota archaeon]|nr:TIGR01906 family membrane protein [Candidatus Woesearchaeota archaeon]
MKIIKIGLVILLAILPFFLSSYMTIFSRTFYISEFEKYRINEKYPDTDMGSYSTEVLCYLRGKNKFMPYEIPLNSKELSHMHDVKTLFSSYFLSFRAILALTIIITSYLLYKKADFSKILVYAGISSLISSVILLLFFSISFNMSFTLFHKLFFEENSWVFHPEDSIVNIYPSGLFFDAAVRIFFLYAVFSFLLLAAGILIKKLKAKN